MKKILIVTPRSPFEGKGADEQDRLAGIEWFVQNGYDTRVITKTMPNDVSHVHKAADRLGIMIIPVPYKFDQKRTRWQSLVRFATRIAWPPYWDGQSFEYFEPEIQAVFKREINSFKPDLAYFDYTYLWPLYRHARACGIPIITRSINVEPLHFLDENGASFFNYVRVMPKWVSEWIAARESSLVFAITPREERIYRVLGANVRTLPLRGLPAKLLSPEPRYPELSHVHLGFTASTYSVAHNLNALTFLVCDVLQKLPRNRYTLHFTGAKLPSSFIAALPHNAVYEGFVPSMNEFWGRMDIAVVPSLFGAGMQQKVFEPIASGIPTVTMPRAIAGYPFDEKHVALASDGASFARAIESLASDAVLRKRIASMARAQAGSIFSRNAIDSILRSGLPI